MSLSIASTLFGGMNVATAVGAGRVKSRKSSWCVALGPRGTTSHRNESTSANATASRTVETTAPTAVLTAAVCAKSVSCERWRVGGSACEVSARARGPDVRRVVSEEGRASRGVRFGRDAVDAGNTRSARHAP